jgi:hypothetical protein
MALGGSEASVAVFVLWENPVKYTDPDGKIPVLPIVIFLSKAMVRSLGREIAESTRDGLVSEMVDDYLHKKLEQ